MARQRLQKPIGIIARQTPSTLHPRVENGSEISTYCWTSNQNQTKQKSNFRNVTNVTITEYNSFLPVVAWALLTQLHSALDLVLANFYKRGSAVCSLQSPPSMLYRNKCIFVRNYVLFLLLSAFFCVYCYFCIFVFLFDFAPVTEICERRPRAFCSITHNLWLEEYEFLSIQTIKANVPFWPPSSNFKVSLSIFIFSFIINRSIGNDRLPLLPSC